MYGIYNDFNSYFLIDFMYRSALQVRYDDFRSLSDRQKGPFRSNIINNHFGSLRFRDIEWELRERKERCSNLEASEESKVVL